MFTLAATLFDLKRLVVGRKLFTGVFTRDEKSLTTTSPVR